MWFCTNSRDALSLFQQPHKGSGTKLFRVGIPSGARAASRKLLGFGMQYIVDREQLHAWIRELGLLRSLWFHLTFWCGRGVIELRPEVLRLGGVYSLRI